MYFEAYIMQIMFLIILACHIPYLFFSGKEALLIIIDETMRRSISLTLSKKLLQNDNAIVSRESVPLYGNPLYAGKPEVLEVGTE